MKSKTGKNAWMMMGVLLLFALSQSAWAQPWVPGSADLHKAKTDVGAYLLAGKLAPEPQQKKELTRILKDMHAVRDRIETEVAGHQKEAKAWYIGMLKDLKAGKTPQGTEFESKRKIFTEHREKMAPLKASLDAKLQTFLEALTPEQNDIIRNFRPAEDFGRPSFPDFGCGGDGYSLLYQIREMPPELIEMMKTRKGRGKEVYKKQLLDLIESVRAMPESDFQGAVDELAAQVPQTLLQGLQRRCQRRQGGGPAMGPGAGMKSGQGMGPGMGQGRGRGFGRGKGRGGQGMGGGMGMGPGAGQGMGGGMGMGPGAGQGMGMGMGDGQGPGNGMGMGFGPSKHIRRHQKMIRSILLSDTFLEALNR